MNSFLQSRRNVHDGRVQLLSASQSSLRMLLHTGTCSTFSECPVPEALNIFIRNELLNEQIPIVFIELPLLCGEDIIVQGIAETQRRNTLVGQNRSNVGETWQEDNDIWGIRSCWGESVGNFSHLHVRPSSAGLQHSPCSGMVCPWLCSIAAHSPPPRL